MIVLDPVTIGAAQLVSSTAAEPSGGDPSPWSAATAYAVNALAYRSTTHRIYRRLVAGTTATIPENDIAGYPGVTTPNWEDYLPTNRWACFDQEVNTQTVQASGPLTVTIAPGVIVNGLTLLEMVGDSVTVSMTDGAAGPTVYTRTVSLVTSLVTDWFQYFFEPFTQQGTLVLLDLPPYLNGRITVSLTGSGAVKLGGLVVGTVYPIGKAQLGASAGILDYSSKKVDDTTGVVKLVKGKYRKTMRVQLQVENGAINKVHDVLTGLRATPVVWVGVEDSSDYLPLVVFGFFKDFSLSVAYPSCSYYSLEIEGMT